MSVPYPALDLASSATAIVFGASSSLHYFSPTTSVSVSTPKNAPTTTYVAGSLLVRLVAISQDGRHAATISDDKSLRVYALPVSSTSSDSNHEIELLSTRHLTKKASAISFTPSPANDLLISDKVGDIYLYPLEANAIPEGTERPLPNNLASDPSLNPDATFLAGHVSIVTSHIFTPDQKFLITADRDEHIRVSHYPNAYNIERFLFGSEGFVSAMHLVPSSSSSTSTSSSSSSSSSAGTGSSSSSSSAQDLLISGGGESVLRVWDWRKGKQLKQIEIFDAVLPHRRVRSSFRRIKDSKKRAKIDTNDLRSGKDEFYTPPDGYILPSGQGVLIKKITSIDVGGKTVVLFFSEG
jgi:tRNA (guanine-N(7)-)-methyltransferase subunit TRM82